MVISEVARLANTPCVKFAVRVLALFGHLVTAPGMVAILAHSRGVVLFLCMLAFRDYFPMFYLAVFFIWSCCVFPGFFIA